MNTQIKVGSFTVSTAEGTGGKNVEVGFVPEFILLWNSDASAADVGVMLRFGGQAADAAVTLLKLTDNGATGTDTINEITSNGITDYDSGSIAASGSPDTVLDSGFQGFTIPAAQLTATDVWHYVAFGAEHTV